MVTAAPVAVALALGWAGAAAAAPSVIQVQVTGSGLTLSTTDFSSLSFTLTGADQTLSSAATGAWSAVDARGTGGAWSVVATSTDLVSAGTPNRVIPAANIRITTGTVTAGIGADPAAGLGTATAAPFTVPTGPGATQVSLLSSPGNHKGAYSFTPGLDVTVPANAEPSYAGVPYQATVTVTIS
jgi:hypothetical protein